MNGKIRDGSMLRIAPFPNTNRKITARLPVQNAIGKPSMSNSPSEPNRRMVSQPMPISRPMASGRLARENHDVLDQLGNALQHQQRGADRHRELHRPVLDAPLRERMLAHANRGHGNADPRPQ